MRVPGARLVDHASDSALRDMRALVQRPGGQSAHRLFWRGAAGWVAAVAAMVILINVEPGPVVFAASLVLALLIGLYGFAGLRRAEAYRSGWIDGRFDLRKSIVLAHVVGGDLHECLVAEQRRDLHIIGVPPDDTI